MRMLLFWLLTALVFFVAEIFLEIVSAKRKNGWVGLILPAGHFIYSLASVGGIVAFSGEPVTAVWQTALLLILVRNIPTIVLLIIYFAVRSKMKKQ